MGFCSKMPSESEKKLWGCPKLIENLLPFLDTYSIICLAKVNSLSQIPNTPSQIPSTPYPILISKINSCHTSCLNSWTTIPPSALLHWIPFLLLIWILPRKRNWWGYYVKVQPANFQDNFTLKAPFPRRIQKIEKLLRRLHLGDSSCTQSIEKSLRATFDQHQTIV